MDAIGTLQPVTTPSGNSHGAGGAGHQLHVAPRQQHTAEQVPPPPKSGEPDFDMPSAESKRYRVVQEVAEQIANLYVVGEQRFTIFKDASGQYVTRFTSLRDGRVTYIPEPDLLSRRQGSGGVPALVQINA